MSIKLVTKKKYIALKKNLPKTQPTTTSTTVIVTNMEKFHLGKLRNYHMKS